MFPSFLPLFPCSPVDWFRRELALAGMAAPASSNGPQTRESLRLVDLADEESKDTPSTSTAPTKGPAVKYMSRVSNQVHPEPGPARGTAKPRSALKRAGTQDQLERAVVERQPSQAVLHSAVMAATAREALRKKRSTASLPPPPKKVANSIVDVNESRSSVTRRLSMRRQGTRRMGTRCASKCGPR